MDKNPLQRLAEMGQSVWLDNIRRDWIESGELQRLIDEDGVVGVTANPTIFEKAISGSTAYDTAIQELIKQGKSSVEIYSILLTEDIANAADILRPIYDRTNGLDGYISIEVAPKLAHDTQGTIKEAVEYWNTVDRPNIFIKVPATTEGVPAIEELLYRGLNINITLIFSVDVYKDVMNAYLTAFERRVAEGKPVDKIASVASFFVSRVDTKADKMLQEKLANQTDQATQDKIKSLLGTTAINNSKLAYQEFLKVFGDERFKKLQAKGAKVQRPLWASTSTKNPAYRDVMYVEELIGPDAVNTMPEQTIFAFKDHGRVERTIDKNLELTYKQLADLESLGISLKQITDELTVEGVESFTKSFDSLQDVIDQKRKPMEAAASEGSRASLGGLLPQVEGRLRQLGDKQILSRIWERDPSVWKKSDAEAQKRIKNRLGWLDVVHSMQDRLPEIETLARQVVEEGYTSVVLLGMGGSALAPEVIYRVLGTSEGYPRFFMLDSTDPGTIAAIERRIDPAKTLFLVSTKSGGTTETISFYRYFREKAGDGKHFVAITDPGSPLEKLARDEGFRHTFLNMEDVGGRYSALSYFGLVPAALMGVDVRALLGHAEKMVKVSGPSASAHDNPGAWLGAIMGECYKEGRDKVTITTSPALDSLGLWAEQLIAESTGKEGKGIVPVTGEPLGRPSAYAYDRLFVYLKLELSGDPAQEHAMDKLEAAGHPVVRLSINDALELGAEFFRWEMAVAVAGAIIGIDPFDEPNVQESKDNTQALLATYQKDGKLPEEEPILTSEGLALYGDEEMLARAGSQGTLDSALRALFSTARPGDYVAILAYMPSTGEQEELLLDARVAIRNTLRVATTFGYGPRYLHSTGQLHKGGPNKGIFLQITADPQRDLPIPGAPYTFGTLIHAQALGDFQSLEKHGRRAVRLHIRGDLSEGVEHAREAIREAVAGLGL
jgi:transaldolase/glucose-6-phosphate isomerase